MIEAGIAVLRDYDHFAGADGRGDSCPADTFGPLAAAVEPPARPPGPKIICEYPAGAFLVGVPDQAEKRAARRRTLLQGL
jgi:hypothetical protein